LGHEEGFDNGCQARRGDEGKPVIFGTASSKLKVSRRAISLLAESSTMPASLTAPEVLNREFLEIRCKILELAAAFDRLGRAAGSVADDPRLARLQEALQVVLDEASDRAEQVQMVFSRPYEEGWQKDFKLKPR
jgi:hypothetical protein